MTVEPPYSIETDWLTDRRPVFRVWVHEPEPFEAVLDLSREGALRLAIALLDAVAEERAVIEAGRQ